MRMIVVPRLGGPEVLTLANVPQPEPKPDQVLIKLHYAALSYGDVYQREGTYRGPMQPGEKPLLIGGEGCGTIVSVGTDVTDLKAGDRVVFGNHLGSYAEYAAVAARNVVRIPDGVSFEDAAGVMGQGVTAHYLAYDTGKLAPGMTCLIHAAAGGVGHCLVQLARLRGAQVIATVGSPDKADFVRQLGADRVVLYRDEDFLDAVRGWGDGKGVDVAYDAVGPETIDRSIKATRTRGLCVLYGNSSGVVDTVSPMDLAAAGSIFFTRPRLAHHMRDRAEIVRRVDDLFAAIQAGKLKLHLNRIFPLDQTAAAHALLQSRQTTGKILLAME
ncbi:MAG: quinone oxidoreductase [Acetobacteraceae bacterium]